MLELKKITKVYKTGDFEQKALDEVSVSFRENEFVCGFANCMDNRISHTSYFFSKRFTL